MRRHAAEEAALDVVIFCFCTYLLQGVVGFGIISHEFFEQEKKEMSQHRSLKGSSKITSKRNVLKRFERVNLLQARGVWKEGDRGLGLKKTKPEA